MNSANWSAAGWLGLICAGGAAFYVARDQIASEREAKFEALQAKQRAAAERLEADVAAWEEAHPERRGEGEGKGRFFKRK